MSEPYDFRKQATRLLQQLKLAPGSPGVSPLALPAVEVALREAYARGAEDSRTGSKGHARTPAAPAPRAAAPSRGSRPEAEPAAVECAHEWEEAFLDGRALGNRCALCGMLHTQAQASCSHYFVRVGAQEVCVACRKPKALRG